MWIRPRAFLKLKPGKYWRFIYKHYEPFLFLSLLFLLFIPSSHALAAETARASDQVLKSKGNSVVLNLVLNQEQKGEFFVNMTDDGDFLVKVEDLRGIGFRRPEGTTIEVSGEPHLSLKSMHNVGFVFNEKELSLIITASPELLPKRTIDIASTRHPKVYFPKGNSAFLNYRLNYSDSSSSEGVQTITNQFGTRVGDILLMSDSTYTRTVDNDLFVRLMSNLTYDRRDDMQRLVVGDLFAASGELGSSVNIGGVGFSKVYRINPYFAKNPILTLSGLISLPSEVEIYLNGVRIRREKISPGEFELRNISYFGGAGDVELVIRDSFGREQRIKYPFYFTDMLLKKGLHEYSYNFGFIREGFGTESNSYGDSVFSAFHRYGITDSVTLGLRGEGAANGFFNLGPQIAYNINNAGIMTISLSKSAGSDGQNGIAWVLDYGYQGRGISARLLTRSFSEEYSTIGTGLTTKKTRLEYVAGIGYGTPYVGNMSVDFSATKKYRGADRQATTLSYSRSLSKRLSGSITIKSIREQEAYEELFIGLSYNTDSDIALSSNYHRSKDEDAILVQAQKSLPVGDGLGYRATLEKRTSIDTSGYMLNPVLQYNTRYSLYEGEYRGNYYNETEDQSDYYQVSASGAVVYAGDTIGFMRPVNDSFGVAKVGNLKGISVYQGGQEIGKTGSSGKALIPNLNSYYDNAISISAKDISLDYTIPEVTKYVSPPFRSGVFINFDVSRFQAVTGRLHIKEDEGIKDVEFYEVRLSAGDKEASFPTGKGGEFYVENLDPGIYTAHFSYKGKECSFTLAVPKSDETFIDVGELLCENIK